MLLVSKIQAQIANQLLTDLSIRLRNVYLDITFDETVSRFVLKNGFNEAYGARPLKRFIERNIETDIAYKLMNGTLIPHQHYVLKVQEDQLIYE